MARPHNCGKCNLPKTQCKCGRPPKLNDLTIGKLREAFAIDASIAEACFYAEIHPSTYYDWINANPKLADSFKALREKPVLKARQEVVKGLDGDKNFSFSYLKSKRPAEFLGQKVAVEHSGKIATDPNLITENMTPEMLEIKHKYERDLFEATRKAWEPKVEANELSNQHENS